MKKIFITRRIPSIAKELLSKYFIVHQNGENKPLNNEELKEVIREYDGVLSTVADRFTPELLKDSKIKVISNYAVGLDNVDLNSAKNYGISVYNTPDVVTNSTADMTLALLLSLVRKINDSHKYVKEGYWKGWDPEIFLGEELDSKTFGIIGFGKIGKAVAIRAKSFGLKVIFFDRNKINDSEFEQVSLNHILENSDYISVHVSLNSDTKNMINAEIFSKMAKKPLFLNMSRGQVVDTESLISALKNGQIRGACLDVTDPEPIRANNPLCSFENCIITPHIGTSTKECRYKMAELSAKNIINHFEKL